MKKVIGWILTVLGGFYCVVGAICIPVILTADDIAFGERIFVLVSFLIIVVVSGIICRIGFKLKAGNGKRDAGNPPMPDAKPAPIRRSACTEKWMTSQLPALYLQKKKTGYRDDYIRRLESIGFQKNDSESRKTESRGICLCSLFSNRMNVLFYAEQSGAVRYDQIAFISFG